MFALFCTLSLRYLWKHWVRAGLVMASIAVGVAAWVTTETLNDSVTRSLRQAASPLRGTADLYATNNATRFLDARLAERLKTNVPGVDRVEPLIIENVKVSREAPDERTEKPEAVLIGLRIPEQDGRPDPLAERNIAIDLDREAFDRGVLADRMRVGLESIQHYVPEPWRPFTRWTFDRLAPRTPVLVGDQLDRDVLKGRKRFTIESGERKLDVEVIGRLRASGPAATLGGQAVLMAWPSAALLLGQPGQVHRLDIYLTPDTDRPTAAEAIRKEVGSVASVQSAEDQDRRLRHVLKGLESGFRLCGFGALVVGLFLVYNAMSVSVAERRHDIGILRSVGATRSQVRLLFLGEATLMGAVGSLLGLPLGILFSYILLAGPIRQSLSGIYLPIIDSEIRVTLPLLAGAFVGGLLTSLLAAIVPASKAAAEEPADAVRRAPPLPGAFYRLLQLGGGTLLILAGVALVALRPLVPELQGAGTFSALGLIMVGAFLLMPALADALTRSAQWATRSWLPIESRLAADNLVRSPGRTGLVIAATAAGVALTVMTAGMIKSNEEAYRDWIDDTIKCDLFVTAGGAGTANAQSRPLPAEAGRKVIDRLPAGSKKVGMVYRYPEWGIPGRGGGEDDTIIFLTLIDARAHYEANAGREPDATRERWRRLADETGTALVSENFALMHNIKVGDSIRLESKGREYWRVIGTVVDYNWIRGSVWIDRLANREAFNADEVNAWEVYLPDEQRGEAARLRDELQRSELGARYNLTTLTREEIRDTYMRMINQVYGLAYTQQMLVGLVAVLGVVAALLISVLSRQRELGLLRAVGATRPQVMHTVLAEAVLIGLVGTVLGIVLGLPLEWYWVRIILFEESGFLFAVRVPWLETVVIALLAVVCATLAGLAPAAQAVRLRIADAIAYE